MKKIILSAAALAASAVAIYAGASASDVFEAGKYFGKY